jgi:hypothetical protein
VSSSKQRGAGNNPIHGNGTAKEVPVRQNQTSIPERSQALHSLSLMKWEKNHHFTTLDT